VNDATVLTRTIPTKETPMKKFFLIAVTCVVLGACSDPPGATKTLEDAGYTNVQTHGHSWFACSKDDTYATSFTATGPTGHPVEGAVCRGFLFKNATIRFN
jgi:hypothetical protein